MSDNNSFEIYFYTAGMIVSAKALLDKDPRPTREKIRISSSENLWLCTGYKKIIDGIERCG